MTKAKIREHDHVAYLTDESEARTVAKQLTQRTGSTPGWLTSDRWPRANLFGLGWAVQTKCFGPYLDREQVEEILAK